MNVGLELSVQGVGRDPELESLVREQVAKLEKVCDQLSSCRVAVERPHQHERSGSPFRVRVEMTVPPGHDLAVVSNPLDHDMHENLSTVVIATFKVARRRLQKLVDRQHEAR